MDSLGPVFPLPLAFAWGPGAKISLKRNRRPGNALLVSLRRRVRPSSEDRTHCSWGGTFKTPHARVGVSRVGAGAVGICFSSKRTTEQRVSLIATGLF